jgi:hypothetical protein
LRALAACACAAALAAGIVACGGDSKEVGRTDGPAGGPGAALAIGAAEAYATGRGVAVKGGTQFLRSTRDPRWALVSGAGGKRGIWAVWLRVDGGRWRPEHALVDGRGDSTPAEVPCDIKPPFSEPECPPE